MQILIMIIIILMYCLILNISLNYILSAVAILITLFSVLLTLFFGYAAICLLFSKRKKAKFSRFDKAENGKYQVAYYLVEGKEYPCVFLKEGVMENQLYQKEKTYNVMLNKRMQKVYDRYAVMTCALGFIVSVGFSIGMIFGYL